MSITWSELAQFIEQMTPEQRGTDVTVLLKDESEFYPCTGTGINSDDEGDEDSFAELDPSHPYIMI